MLCEKCGVNNATTHIRTIINGVVHEKHFCSHCAANNGAVLHCKCCGSTLGDIINSGKAGCSECYATFYNQLLPYIAKVQLGRKSHCGKTPNVAVPEQKPTKKSIDDLKILLNKLVDAEEYEKAAIIRDKIKLLEVKMI